MNDELISQIVRRILQDPAFAQLVSAQETTVCDKPQVLVLLNFTSDLSKTLAKLQELWGEKYCFKVLGSNTVAGNRPELPKGMSWVEPEEARKSCYAKVLLPTCSASTLAKIALGLRDCLVCELAAKAILEGTPIEIAVNLGFTPNTPQTYKNLYQGYINQVQSFGVVVYPTADALCMACGETVCSSQLGLAEAAAAADSQASELKSMTAEAKTEENVIHWTKKLLTEYDAVAIPKNSVLKVAKSTIISPLGQDKLNDRRIEVRREV